MWFTIARQLLSDMYRTLGRASCRCMSVGDGSPLGSHDLLTQLGMPAQDRGNLDTAALCLAIGTCTSVGRLGDLEHDDRCLKDNPAGVLPCQRLLLPQATVLLTLHEITDRPPVSKESVEERLMRLPDLLPV